MAPWACVTERPGSWIAYANNRPPHNLVRIVPTGIIRIPSAVSSCCSWVELEDTVSADQVVTVGSTSKGAIIGVIRSEGEVTTFAVEACSDTVRAAIKGTSKVGGGDVGAITRSAVEGAWETSKSVGLRSEDTASSVTRGVIQGTT